MSRFVVKNFGCRAAQADGAAIEASLTAQGGKTGTTINSDLVVLNTCTVTATADTDLRYEIRRIHHDNPTAKILVTGCYAQRAPQEISALPGVQWVVGNSHKTQIADIVGDQTSPTYHSQIHIGDITAHTEFLSAPAVDSLSDRTRPNLKIQDGCNNLCSFCIIPSVRGRSRSANAEDVVAQVQSLGARYREVVLSGINLGRWGRDVGAPQGRLVDLLRRLLNETSAERLRISSVEPMDFSDDLLQLMADSPRIAPHVHAPLQSASDTVLKRMKRRYRSRHYASRIETARKLLPDAAIGADVMVGFPGETEGEFEETYRFIQDMPFTYLHVFTYSERPDTPAVEIREAVPMSVRRERNAALRQLAERKNLEFRRRFVGKTLSVVTLRSGHGALSDNFLKIQLASPREANQLLELSVGGISTDGLMEANPLRVLA